MGPSRRLVLRSLGVAGIGGVAAIGYLELGTGSASRTVTALVAGSLLELADRIPGASVEAHGSVAARRLVLNGLRTPDAMALADPALFDGISDRATHFATNALVLVYDPTTPVAGDLRADWQSTVTDPEVTVGRTDPTKDPLGYRTVMALRLAEREYGLEADHLLAGSSVFLETDLLNVLEGGQIDTAFAYRNMAVQRNLPYVDLPDAIDFSNPAFNEQYASVSVDLGDQSVRGAPIVYAATALTPRGRPWVDRLVGATELLRDAGFSVPTDYPHRDVAVQAGSGSTTEPARGLGDGQRSGIDTNHHGPRS